MKTFLLYGAIIISTAFFLGLLFYGFYIVLTSKEENYTTPQTNDSSEKTTGSKPVHPGKVDKPKTGLTANDQSDAQIPDPPKKAHQKPIKTHKKNPPRAA